MAISNWKLWNNVGNRFHNFRSQVKHINFRVPEKYKGTVLEKWALYWKNLLQDYRDVIVDTVRDAREKPKKATIILTGMGFLTYCGKNNPDKRSFRDKLLISANDMIIVSDITRKPAATEHLIFLEKCYNAGLMRRLSLGVISFMWLDNYDKNCAIYESQCSYLKPRYLTFHQRIVDVGFLSHWWCLERTMQDYDVNPTEFVESEQKFAFS